jgi:multidrug efflux pump subunit AcrA (membrane-fusion protein)
MNKARARITAINTVLALIVAGIGWWGWSALHPAAATVATTTTTVSLADVTSTVSASGTVISPGDMGISPQSSGQITAINVKVGDSVHAGQLLATLDSSSQLNSLNQAKSALQTAQIQYAQSAASLATAKDNAVQSAVGYQNAIDSAKKALADAQTNEPLKQAGYQFTVDNAKAASDQAQKVYDSYSGFYGPSGFTLAYCASLININSNCTTLYTDYNNWQSALKSYNNALSSQTISLNNDASSLANLTAAITTAQTAQTQGIKKDQAAIVSAQASLDLLRAQLGVNVDSPAAADFSVAQASLALAQKNYDNTFIKAPVSGTVASITGVVGTNATTQSSSTVGSVTGFIVLTNVSGLEVKASFSEADAAKLIVGQVANYTFSALSSATASGKLISIDPLPTTSGGATSYTAYFSIDGSVDGLKPGMSVTPVVVIGAAYNVLSVASQAVTIRGTGASVTVVTTKNGVETTTRMPVVLGLQGDTLDQIISGVKAGDKVVLRAVSSSTGSNGFPAVGGAGGIGGIGGGAVPGAGRAGAGGFGG